MKTKEELNAIRGEIDTLNKKLAELSEDELQQVVGGLMDIVDCPNFHYRATGLFQCPTPEMKWTFTSSGGCRYCGAGGTTTTDECPYQQQALTTELFNCPTPEMKGVFTGFHGCKFCPFGRDNPVNPLR